METKTYSLVNDEGCLMKKIKSTSFKKAREKFNCEYEGRFVIVCDSDGKKKNVILK